MGVYFSKVYTLALIEKLSAHFGLNSSITVKVEKL